MQQIRLGLMTVLAAALLAACGGGNDPIPGSGAPAGAPESKVSFQSVVSFGDSLSDIGSYAPATVHPQGPPPHNTIGGKFTTNLDGAGPTVWVEYLARNVLGLSLTPAEVGFNKASVKCPVGAAVPALAGSCTAYGQGGAMITSTQGYGQAADGNGPLAVPVVTQIANHLARFGSFKDSDLVLVWAGHNELFTLLDPRLEPFPGRSFVATVARIKTEAGAAAAQVQARALAGTISADEAQRQAAEITAAASRQLFSAQTAAQLRLKTAAQDLTRYVREQILAKGARHVVVLTMVDTSFTPEGLAQDGAGRQLLTDLADTFNLWLREGLTDQPVKLIDSTALLREAVDNPAQYGFENVRQQACDNAAIQRITGGAVTDGNPIFCNGTTGAIYNTLAAGASPLTWFFADEVHPSAGGHQFISDRVAEQLKAFGWL